MLRRRKTATISRKYRMEISKLQKVLKKGVFIKTVIGLVGVKTSGKSTVANILKQIISEKTEEAALADKLKNVCSEVFGVERKNFDEQSLKEVKFKTPVLLNSSKIESILKMFNVSITDGLLQKYLAKNIEGMLLESPRHIAQIVGTEILRTAGDEDVHCKNLKLGDNVTIVSDIRFPNEFMYFDKLNNIKFIPLYIHRIEAEKQINENSHSSETSVFHFCDKCLFINNNSTLEDLEKELEVNLNKTNLLLKRHNL